MRHVERLLSDAIVKNHHPRQILKAVTDFLQSETGARRVEIYQVDSTEGRHQARRVHVWPEPARPVPVFEIDGESYGSLSLSAMAGVRKDFPQRLRHLFNRDPYVQLWPCVSPIWEGFICLGFAGQPETLVPISEELLQSFANTLGWMLRSRTQQHAWDALHTDHTELERQLQTVISNLPGFVYRLHADEKSSAEFLSPGVFDITGYRPEVFYQGDANLRKGIDPEQQAEIAQQIQQSIRLQQPYEMTYLYRTATLEKRWFWERGRGVFDKQGELKYYEGFVTDITAQKESEQELALLNQNLEARVQERAQELDERQVLFDAIVNSAQDGIIMIDDKERILFWNRSAEQIFGYTDAEVRGENLHQLLAPEHYHADIRQGFDHFKETGESSILNQLREVTARHKDGRELHIELSIAGVKQKDTYQTVGIVRDISARKEREARLKTFFELAESSAQGISMATLDGDITYVNSKMYKMLGEDSAESVQGRHMSFYYTNSQQKILETDIMDTLMVEGEWVGELELRSSKGQIIPTIQNFFIVYDDDANPVLMANMVTDISEQKATEVQLQQAQKLADEANQAKSAFLANMSHEIRTPMNAIIGLGHLLQKTELNAKQNDYARKIHGAAQNLLGIINDILDFSKIEANKMDIEVIPFDLHRVLTNISTLLAVRAEEKELELIFKVSPDVPQFLMGDPLRMEQILLNLSNNALKFTEEGSITIAGELLWEKEKELYLRFEVRDTGIGMTQEQQDKLFKAFSQADASTSRKFGGTGLGLTISKRLVEMMGGEIGVNSKPGMGSTFFFTVKMERSEQQEPLQIPADLQHKRVLIVDDQPVVLEVLQDYMSHFNIPCVAVASGEAAIDTFRKAKAVGEPFDLVLLDWNMPGMNGVETLARLRQLIDDTCTKIFMMTAYGREDIVDTLRKLQVDNLLLKPITQSILYDHLVEHLSASGERVRLPVSTAKAMDLSAIKGARVLLVEDNLINQQIAQELLEDEGLVVDIAFNGQEAVERLENDLPLITYDIVLMDLQMPLMDGYEATRALRANSAFDKLPIVAMTADAVTGVKERVLEAGMNDYVTKPIQLDVLSNALLHWIQLQNMETQSESPGVSTATASKPDASDLSTLSCLNYADAMTRMGGKEKLLKRLLLQFVTENEAEMERLEATLTALDWDQARRLAHTLKGSAGNLGLEDIFTSAQALEKALHDPADVFENTPLAKAFNMLKQSMEQAITEIKNHEEPAVGSAETVEVDTILLRELLQKVKAAVENFDASAGEQLEHLLSVSGDQKNVRQALKDILKCVEAFEHDAALEKIDALQALGKA